MLEKTLAFGYPFFVRVVLPGSLGSVVLYIVLLPFPWFHRVVILSQGFELGLFFAIAVLGVGLLVSFADSPIYMLYEGWTLWPSGLKKWRINYWQRKVAERLKIEDEREKAEKRLGAAQEKLNKATNEREKEAAKKELENAQNFNRQVELSSRKTWEWLNQFPLNEKNEPAVLLPTILGNILYSYETYSREKYGMNSPFYWYRLWLKLDEKVRQEIEKMTAPADALTYLSFVALMSLIPLTAMFLGSMIGSWLPLITLSDPGPDLRIFWGVTLVILAFLSWLFYGLSIFHHRSSGEVFKAMFDVYRKDLEHIRIVEETIDQEREMWDTTWRYLRYGMRPKREPEGPSKSDDR